MKTYKITLQDGQSTVKQADTVMFGAVGELILAAVPKPPMDVAGNPYGIQVDPRPQVIKAFAPGQWSIVELVQE